MGGTIAPCTSPDAKEMILCCLVYDESIRSHLFSMKVRIVLLQVDKIKFEGSEENSLMSVPGNFSPQELIGHFLFIELGSQPVRLIF